MENQSTETTDSQTMNIQSPQQIDFPFSEYPWSKIMDTQSTDTQSPQTMDPQTIDTESPQTTATHCPTCGSPIFQAENEDEDEDEEKYDLTQNTDINPHNHKFPYHELILIALSPLIFAGYVALLAFLSQFVPDCLLFKEGWWEELRVALLDEWFWVKQEGEEFKGWCVEVAI